MRGVRVFDGCVPVIASAVEVFNRRLGQRATPHTTIRLLETTIEPAWRTYISSLPEDHPWRAIFLGLSISQLAREIGFKSLEDFVVSRHRAFVHQGYSAERSFHATIDTVREIVFSCWVKRSTTGASRRRDRPHQKLCEFCGNATEFSSWYPDDASTAYDPDFRGEVVKPSVKYCRKHRPKFVNGTPNPEYLWASRHHDEFLVELSRLNRRSTSMSASDINTDVDAFYLALVAPHAVYPDEKSKLRNEARQLVDARVDDRKRQMVMLRVAGKSLGEVAVEIGLGSRQAVSKSLSTIPARYRLDLALGTGDRKKTSLLGEGSAINVLPDKAPAALKAALDDSCIVEVFLDTYGSLVAESDVGKKVVGTIDPADAAQIISWVAQSAGMASQNLTGIVEADLPALRIRFCGMLPPIVDKPIFTIRKVRAWKPA